MISRRLDTPANRSAPRVLIIGGEDVDARIELMHRLKDEFDVAAAGSSPDLDERFAEHGFRYFFYPLCRGNAPVQDVRTIGALIRLLRAHRPHLVHSFDSKPCVYGRLAARLARVPFVVGTIPGLGSLYVNNGRRRLVRSIYEKLQGWSSRLADLTIFQNHDDARDFVGRGVVPANKYLVIPGSGVRTDLFDATTVSAEERRKIRANLDLPPEAVLVTMVTRVIPTKGVEEFVGAARQIQERRADVRFLLVGPADSESVDRYSPEELEKIKKTVRWPGARRDIARILAASDVFVLPSFYREGIPRSLLEAAATGLPLVTTRSPGCSEVVVDGENGILVPTRDTQALTQALASLIDSEELRRRFGKASRRLAVNRFDLAKIAEQTRSVYRNFLGT